MHACRPDTYTRTNEVYPMAKIFVGLSWRYEPPHICYHDIDYIYIYIQWVCLMIGCSCKCEFVQFGLFIYGLNVGFSNDPMGSEISIYTLYPYIYISLPCPQTTYTYTTLLHCIWLNFLRDAAALVDDPATLARYSQAAQKRLAERGLGLPCHLDWV